MKKFGPWCLAAMASMAPLGALGGMSGVLAGHTAVLAITLGIFVGTLSLGRTSSQTTRAPGETQLGPVAALIDDRGTTVRVDGVR